MAAELAKTAPDREVVFRSKPFCRKASRLDFKGHPLDLILSNY